MLLCVQMCDAALGALQVQVEVPDVQGRWDILKVHAKNKKLADDVNLESVAMRVPGDSLCCLQRTLQRNASAHACLSTMQAIDTDVHDSDRLQRRRSGQPAERVSHPHWPQKLDGNHQQGVLSL